MKRLFIIHGYQASPEDHWFKWLASKMKKYNYQSVIVPLPNSSHPIQQQWRNRLQDYMENALDEDSIIVAHSLGVIAVLEYLSHANLTREIKGLFLVSGFAQPLNTISELDDFVQACNINYESIPARLIYTIGATEDPAVPINYTEALSDKLNTNTIKIDHQGHFLGREGYKSFPELFELIQNSINDH
ncbi:alpha/beta hydrolase [Staphylococcus sp. SQ8-PEA]|uniref:Alpha/beta hydrolase n=1 Tax=Staphylococcus marylandisciuri TaxID=2981529 RepID=A0ABT2QNH1_9STAP|nr:alpha/beta hydrolase [Staphylococcus marylandisciuri]MCU5745511.1 alpha/beta hydrolase [Staphylococcus marylandisciuri]